MLLKLLIGVFFCLAGSSVRAEDLRIAYSAINGAQAPLWVAVEESIFSRHGLNVELIYIGGGSVVAERADLARCSAGACWSKLRNSSIAQRR